MSAADTPMKAITAEFDRIMTDAALRAGRTMAAIKGGKPEVLISDNAARAAFLDPEMPGDADLTARTLRGGEASYIRALLEHQLFDANVARWRLEDNQALDRGETTILSMPSTKPYRRVSDEPVTGEEVRAAPVDPDLGGRALRAGEVAFIQGLTNRGFYDLDLAQSRIDANAALDRGEVPLIATPSPIEPPLARKRRRWPPKLKARRAR